MNKKSLFIENKSIKNVFEEAVSKYKDSPFLAYPKTNQNSRPIFYTYSEVNRIINNFIVYFKKVKLQPKERVCVGWETNWRKR